MIDWFGQWWWLIVLGTMVISDWSFLTMGINNWSLGAVMWSGWSLVLVIIYWSLEAVVISEWSLGAMVMSDWCLETIVMRDWSLGSVVVSGQTQFCNRRDLRSGSLEALRFPFLSYGNPKSHFKKSATYIKSVVKYILIPANNPNTIYLSVLNPTNELWFG